MNILNKSEGENLKLLNESIDVLKTHSFNIQAKLIEDLKFLDNEEFILKPKKNKYKILILIKKKKIKIQFIILKQKNILKILKSSKMT